MTCLTKVQIFILSKTYFVLFFLHLFVNAFFILSKVTKNQRLPFPLSNHIQFEFKQLVIWFLVTLDEIKRAYESAENNKVEIDQAKSRYMPMYTHMSLFSNFHPINLSKYNEFTRNYVHYSKIFSI